MYKKYGKIHVNSDISNFKKKKKTWNNKLICVFVGMVMSHMWVLSLIATDCKINQEQYIGLIEAR